MADIAAAGASGKVVIKNIGLLLSGDIDRPILQADTIVVMDGIITAVTLSGPSASAAMAKVSAESMPPESPITTPGKRCFST